MPDAVQGRTVTEVEFEISHADILRRKINAGHASDGDLAQTDAICREIGRTVRSTVSEGFGEPVGVGSDSRRCGRLAVQASSLNAGFAAGYQIAVGGVAPLIVLFDAGFTLACAEWAVTGAFPKPGEAGEIGIIERQLAARTAKALASTVGAALGEGEQASAADASVIRMFHDIADFIDAVEFDGVVLHFELSRKNGDVIGSVAVIAERHSIERRFAAGQQPAPDSGEWRRRLEALVLSCPVSVTTVIHRQKIGFPELIALEEQAVLPLQGADIDRVGVFCADAHGPEIAAGKLRGCNGLRAIEIASCALVD